MVSPQWVRMARKSQKLKPFTKEQQNLTKDQRSFLVGLRMHGSGYQTVYGYGAGRPIRKQYLNALKRRGLIKYKNWKQQKYSKAYQADVMLTAKGKKFAKAFYY